MKLILYITLFVPLFSFSQTTFFSAYGGNGNDYGKSIVTAIDTSYTVVGATESFGNGIADVYLFNIDTLGNLNWSKTFGGNNIDWGLDLKQTLDSGYIICGYSNSFSWDYDIYLVKTDQNGDSLWTKTIGGSDWDFANSVSLTQDTGYIIAGETYTSASGISDAYAVKVNNIGDTLWTNKFGSTGKDWFTDVIETYDGKLLFAGATTTADGDTDFWLVKTDSAGNELWQYTQGDSLNEVINSVVEVVGNNYFFIGDRESITGNSTEMDFHKISESGSYLLGNTYGFSNEETGKFILQYGGETDLILGGSSNSVGNGGYEVLNLKIGSSGFGTIYANDGSVSDDIVEQGDTTIDNSIVIVGTTDETNNGIKSVFVMKTDSLLKCTVTIYDVFDITSVPSIVSQTEISTYPNPVNNFLTIKSDINLSGKQYKVYNLLGEVIQCDIIQENKIMTSNINPGIYFLFIPELSGNAIQFTKI